MSYFNDSVEGKMVKVEILQVMKPNELMIKSKRSDLSALPKLEKQIRLRWTEAQLFDTRDKIPEKNACVLVKSHGDWKGYRRGCVQRIYKTESTKNTNTVFNVFLYDHGKKHMTTLANMSKILPEHLAVRPFIYLLTVQAVYPTIILDGRPKWTSKALDFVKQWTKDSTNYYGLKVLLKPSTFHIVGDLLALNDEGNRKYQATLGEFLRAKKLALDMKQYNDLLLTNVEVNSLKKAAIPNIFNKTTGQISQFSPDLDPNGNENLMKIANRLRDKALAKNGDSLRISRISSFTSHKDSKTVLKAKKAEICKRNPRVQFPEGLQK